MLLFYSSYSMYLNEDQESLMRQVAEALKMPLQPPVEVKACTKVSKEDNITGRTIQYHLSDCVAFDGAYGEMELLFCYRSTFFTIVKKFRNTIEIEPGLKTEI